MFLTFMAPFLSDNSTIDQRWSFMEERRVAEQAFFHSRRRARARAIRKLIGTGSLSPLTVGGDTRGFSLPIASVDGIVRSDGRLSRGVPPLPRRSCKAWVETFVRFGPEFGESPFFVREDKEGRWYLEGGISSILRLEILREKGMSSLRAIRISRPPESCCGDLPEGCSAGDDKRRLAC